VEENAFFVQINGPGGPLRTFQTYVEYIRLLIVIEPHMKIMPDQGRESGGEIDPVTAAASSTGKLDGTPN
jgi:hypothetical protein